MSFLKARWATLIAVLVFASSAHANLVVNGSFEDNAVAEGSWNWFPSANVNGWEGSNVEIWHNLFGIVAPQGLQLAELNADGPNSGAWSIFQNLATVAGQTYDVSFFYRARVDNNESFNFSVGTLNALVNDHVVGQWSTFTGSFVATSAVTQLRFTSNNQGTLGNLLDDVQVNARTSVPESSAFMLFTLGLLSLIFVRKIAAK